jgi:hypothetical protein
MSRRRAHDIGSSTSHSKITLYHKHIETTRSGAFRRRYTSDKVQSSAAKMTRILEVARTGTNETMKEEVLHIEDARPHKKSRFSRTKDFTAADIAAIAISLPQQNYDLLQASPYSDRAHLLDLTTLAKPLQLFAEALTAMRWIKQEYATAPYDKAFNWDSIVDVFSRTIGAESPDSMPEKLDFYVIVFRSRVNQYADRQLLGELDKAAHLEAVESGGLLKYWFGEPDEAGRNLATCEFSRSILWNDVFFRGTNNPGVQ